MPLLADAVVAPAEAPIDAAADAAVDADDTRALLVVVPPTIDASVLCRDLKPIWVLGVVLVLTPAFDADPKPPKGLGESVEVRNGLAGLVDPKVSGDACVCRPVSSREAIEGPDDSE